MATFVMCTNPRCNVTSHISGSQAEARCQRAGSPTPAQVAQDLPVVSATGSLPVTSSSAAEFADAHQLRTRLDAGVGKGARPGDQDVMDRHRREGEAWLETLNDSEKYAVSKHSMASYYGTNDSLRAGIENYSVGFLDSALAKVPGGQSHVLYRGVSFEGSAGEALTEYAVGQEIVFPEYLSASHCPQVATTFAMDDIDGFIFEILTDKGAAITSQVGSDEFERLLPRGMRFKVVGIRDDIAFETDTSSGGETFPVVQLVEITD